MKVKYFDDRKFKKIRSW